jgi:three-Cys-motif partner protein
MAKKTTSGRVRIQVFGGPWSLIKVELVDRYLHFFNTALKNRPFERVYIDAFAGSGAFRYVINAPKNTLFGARDETKDIHDGSAIRALRAAPPFNKILFIENNKRNAASLRELIKQSGHPDATVIPGDANDTLMRYCRPRDWKTRRGVIFLDPFGMNVKWSTLEAIAKTQALDVWLLFPLGATIRNLPRNARALDSSKRDALTRLFGDDEWFDEFYRPASRPSRTLFRLEPGPPLVRRTAEVNDVEAYMKRKLEEIFAHVESPKRLKGPKNQSLFSLFFAMSNPSPAAVNLARRVAAHILSGM